MLDIINKDFGQFKVITNITTLKYKAPSGRRQLRHVAFIMCNKCGTITKHVNVKQLIKTNRQQCQNCWKTKYFIGQQIEDWTIIKILDNSKLLCRCKCGKEKELLTSNCNKENTKRCKACYGKTLRKNLSGEIFGRLLVLKHLKQNQGKKNRSSVWYCLCFCGKYCEKKGSSLVSGACKSCGCLWPELAKQRRGSKSPLWNPNLTDKQRNIRDNDKLETVWSYKIKEKDNFTCLKCGIKHKGIISHHIAGYTRYPEVRYDLNNGICLCENCHKSFHKLYGIKRFNPLDTFEFIYFK